MAAEPALAHPGAMTGVSIPLDADRKAPLVLLGPSLAWSSHHGRSELVVGADLTLACRMAYLTEGLGAPDIDLFDIMHGWISLGATSAMARDRWVAPYAELGGWLFVNLGVGYGLLNDGGGWRHGMHLFAGLPIPLGDGPTARHWVIQPYYRYYFAYHPRPTERTHEAGLLLKWGSSLP